MEQVLRFLALLSELIAAGIFARSFFLSDKQIKKMTMPTWDIGPAEEEMRGWLFRNRREAKLGLFFLALGFVLQLLAQFNSNLNLLWSFFLNIFLKINWNSVEALGTVIAVIVASWAAVVAYRTWKLEKLPIVHAVGTFIISKVAETNTLRDNYIHKPDSLHSLQLVNVGRGPAKNVIPSVRKDSGGLLLEAANPHSFSIPANKGTNDLKEVLLVHGQRFVNGDEYELEFEGDRKIGYFYIYFEDHEDNRYFTKVKISKVERADGELGNLVNTTGTEVWKVVDNVSLKC